MQDLLKPVRDQIFTHFWASYRAQRPEVQQLEKDLLRRGKAWIHDHHAILDLEGPHSGPRVLREIFELIGYVHQGSGYIPEKQNRFCWLAPLENMKASISETGSQLVLADFRLSECSSMVQAIVRKSVERAAPAPLEAIRILVDDIRHGDLRVRQVLAKTIIDYLEAQAWPRPTKKDFEIVLHENELLAWTLVFGRRVNHFTLAAHLIGEFRSLSQFNSYARENYGYTFNSVAGEIKGNPGELLEQSSSLHCQERVRIADAEVLLPGSFIEFVWRYPREMGLDSQKWASYFNGFISKNANNVVESLIKSAPSA